MPRSVILPSLTWLSTRAERILIHSEPSPSESNRYRNFAYSAFSDFAFSEAGSNLGRSWLKHSKRASRINGTMPGKIRPASACPR